MNEEEATITIENINDLLKESINTITRNKIKLKDYKFQFSPSIVTEIEKVINENAKLKQEIEHKTKMFKQSLYEWTNEINNLNHQLQAYKDKEDKIREYINTWVIDEYSIAVSTDDDTCEGVGTAYWEPEAIDKLLQILDGSDK